MPKILYIIKVILIFWAFKFGAELIGEGLVIALHFACGKNPLKGEMFSNNTITLITFFGYGIMIGIIVLFWKLFQKKGLKELGFVKPAASYFAGVLAGMVLLLISVAAITLTGAIEYNGVFGNIDYRMVAVMFICFVLQGALEEILCRGIRSAAPSEKDLRPFCDLRKCRPFYYPAPLEHGLRKPFYCFDCSRQSFPGFADLLASDSSLQEYLGGMRYALDLELYSVQHLRTQPERKW